MLHFGTRHRRIARRTKAASIMLTCVLLLLGLKVVEGSSSTCSFIADAPVIEQEIPSFMHTLKVLGDLDVKIYRHSLTELGLTKPRIKGEVNLALYQC